MNPSSDIITKFIDLFEQDELIALKNSNKNYLLPSNIFELEKNVDNILSIGNQTGEGWFLTAEMVEFIKNDIKNIVCVQPFACLPNHVVGKGVIKTIRNKYEYEVGLAKRNGKNVLGTIMMV